MALDVADDGNFGHPRLNDYRTHAKSYNTNGPLIGEIWPNASQFLAGDQMDSVMNYRFRKNITGFVRNVECHDDNNNGTNNIPGLTPSQFDHAIRAVRDDYPPQSTAAMLNLLDSHDVNRALYVMTELGDTGLVQAKQRLELAALFQFTYIGAPMVYYGDEVAVNSPSQTSSANGPIGDPYTRPPYPLDRPGRRPGHIWPARYLRAGPITPSSDTCVSSIQSSVTVPSSRCSPVTPSNRTPLPTPTPAYSEAKRLSWPSTTVLEQYRQHSGWRNLHRWRAIAGRALWRDLRRRRRQRPVDARGAHRCCAAAIAGQAGLDAYGRID